jgi:hypothetical protein
MFMFARTVSGRKIERWLNSDRHPRPSVASETVFSGVDANKAVRELNENGVALGLGLPSDFTRRILRFAETTECFARDDQETGFLPRNVADMNRARARDIITGYYFEKVEDSPEIRQLKTDPMLRSIAGAYIGQTPVWIRTRLWWSFPAERVTDADLHAVAQEKFHFDMNGWRTVKFFFYITAADEQSGAHRCIVGSHRSRPIGLQLTMTVGRPTEELAAVYGKEKFLTITGEAGTGFAEDPFIFHTGSLCRDRPRLILELEYAANSVSPSYTYGRLG